MAEVKVTFATGSTTGMISFIYPSFFPFTVLFILFCCEVHHLHSFTGLWKSFTVVN